MSLLLLESRVKASLSVCAFSGENYARLRSIKTLTKFSNVIGYHQPSFRTDKTLHASYTCYRTMEVDSTRFVRALFTLILPS